MPGFNQFIIQPEIRDKNWGKDWKNFARGAASAGYDFLLLQNDTEIRSYQTESEQARYLIEIPLPDLMNKLFRTFRPFVLRNESMSLYFYQPEGKKTVLRLYSDNYSKKELNDMPAMILPHLAQQYAYQRTLDLFREKDYTIIGESVFEEHRILVTIRRWNFIGEPVPDLLGNEITILSGPQKEEIEFQIYPNGILRFDLTAIEPENRERYYRWLTDELGKVLQKKRFESVYKKLSRQAV